MNFESNYCLHKIKENKVKDYKGLLIKDEGLVELQVANYKLQVTSWRIAMTDQIKDQRSGQVYIIP